MAWRGERKHGETLTGLAVIHRAIRQAGFGRRSWPGEAGNQCQAPDLSG